MWNLLPQKLHACSTPFCLFPTGLVRAEMIRRDRDPSSSECVSSQSISQQFTVWSALGSSHSLSLDGTSCAMHLHHNWRQGAQRWPWNWFKADQTMTKQPLGFRGPGHRDLGWFRGTWRWGFQETTNGIERQQEQLWVWSPMPSTRGLGGW